MGTSQGFDYRTGRWVLDCAQCGALGGVRKRRCPVNYCPSSQLCAACFAKVKADGLWGEIHKDCARLDAEYRAQEAAKNAEPHAWAAAAWGDWDDETPSGMVRVLTRAETTVFVKAEDYHGGGHRLPDYALNV